MGALESGRSTPMLMLVGGSELFQIVSHCKGSSLASEKRARRVDVGDLESMRGGQSPASSGDNDE